MPSAWIERRTTPSGATRYRVRYRVGGRESTPRLAGTFARKSDALTRRGWVLGELSAMRVPDTRLLVTEQSAPTFSTAAEEWRGSRVDVSAGTAATYLVNLGRITPTLGERPVDEITPSDVAALVAVLDGAGLARESVRKTLATMAMVLDFAGVTPNPARDRLTVKLPREIRPELNPPAASHVLAVHALLPQRYRLPLLVLDSTGMRVGELEALTWGDVDESRQRWRVSQAVAKTGRARWVTVHEALFEATLELVPREDRTAERRAFQAVTAERLRTAITRACTAVGVPAFSPHDLRHRRISLLHLGGVPWARFGEHVGQRNLSVTANTYTRVLTDETEIDYAGLVGV